MSSHTSSTGCWRIGVGWFGCSVCGEHHGPFDRGGTRFEARPKIWNLVGSFWRKRARFDNLCHRIDCPACPSLKLLEPLLDGLKTFDEAGELVGACFCRIYYSLLDLLDHCLRASRIV
jgi:hypothetical protein